MRKVLFLIGILNLIVLTGCVSENDERNNDDIILVYSLNVDLVFQEYSWIESDGGSVYTPGNVENVSGVYTVDSIEMLISDYGVFPYKSMIIEDDVEELITIMQNILDGLSDEQTIGGALPSMTLKEKLSIDFTRNGNILGIDFYQDENGKIVSMKVMYNDNETLFEGVFSDEYASFYFQLDDYIQSLENE